MRTAGAALAAVLLLGAAAPTAHPAADYLADARALDREVATQYAYLDRFPGGNLPDTARLRAEREAVHDSDTLLHYAEDRLTSLADHHAITVRSFGDDWALVPSYADLWVVAAPGGYRVDAVRAGSPAAGAGILPGDELVAMDGRPMAAAVAAFWAPLALDGAGERGAYAARVLAAGRRDRPRVLTLRGSLGERTLTLPNLYAPAPDRPPVSVVTTGAAVTIRFNNSLGDQATTAAFDAAMAATPRDARLTLDLTDTPSGGNTSVARGIMGWFASHPTGYQRHRLMAEERETGIARQWTEEVLPRPGRHFAGRATVRVGRWTGSMGEGLAVGLAALGERVCGTAMAGLRGAVYDIKLPATGLTVKLPTERTSTIAGQPREDYVPPRCARG